MSKSRFGLAILILTGALVFAAQASGLRARAASPQGNDDSTIVSDIQSKLFDDSVLKTRDIRVTSQDGVVTLSGTVNTALEKAAVERLASRESGVKKVVDSLTVSGSPANSGGAPVANSSSAASGITIPAGTVLTVRMIDAIDSAKNHAGDEFAASLNSAVVVGNHVAFPQGSEARVRLVEAKKSGHFKGASQLELELASITANGVPYQVESGYYTVSGSSRGKRTAETVGGGAVLGTLLGAIAGGGKGAAIGAGAGAATGAGVQAVTRGAQVKVPSETKLDFTLKSAVTLR
jgi:BON domain